MQVMPVLTPRPCSATGAIGPVGPAGPVGLGLGFDIVRTSNDTARVPITMDDEFDSITLVSDGNEWVSMFRQR